MPVANPMSSIKNSEMERMTRNVNALAVLVDPLLSLKRKKNAEPRHHIMVNRTQIRKIFASMDLRLLR